MLPLILLLGFLQGPPVRKNQSNPASDKSEVSKQVSASAKEPVVVQNVTSSEQQNKPREESKWWPPPSLWDIYWPTVGLVFATGIAVAYGIKTLGAIRDQVTEMRNAKGQTEK